VASAPMLRLVPRASPPAPVAAPTTWAELQVTGPPARAGGAIAPVDGKLVLFGGYDESNTGVGGTWVWDGTAWSQIDGGPAPTPRYAAVMATPSQETAVTGGAR